MSRISLTVMFFSLSDYDHHHTYWQFESEDVWIRVSSSKSEASAWVVSWSTDDCPEGGSKAEGKVYHFLWTNPHMTKNTMITEQA